MVGVVGSSPIAPTNFPFSDHSSGITVQLRPVQHCGSLRNSPRRSARLRFFAASGSTLTTDRGILDILRNQMSSTTTVPTSASSHTAIESALEEMRLAALLRQAPLEFARVVYGLNDRANGRAGTMAAEEVARTVRQGSPVTRERAEQRARAYLPVAGQEHCPRCWIFNGIKSPLHYREPTDTRPESAACKVCGAEYATALD
jgi:hypothetical protein